MAKAEKHPGTTPAGVLGAVTTGDQRAAPVDPLRFYSPRDPWEVFKCDDGGLIVCTKGDIICHSDRNHPADDPADLALFPMIAAAPKMLAALTKTRDNLSGLSRSPADIFAAMVRRLDDAIAAAHAPIPHPDKPRDDGTAVEPGHEPGARA